LRDTHIRCYSLIANDVTYAKISTGETIALPRGRTRPLNPTKVTLHGEAALNLYFPEGDKILLFSISWTAYIMPTALGAKFLKTYLWMVTTSLRIVAEHPKKNGHYQK